jgi:deoxyribodipyrimidine photolyase
MICLSLLPLFFCGVNCFKMSSLLRMYWCKQIIGWVADPKVALEYSLRLNNRWELDAVDPNSYAGVMWCFGKHDQGWKEREIWGKVRYMTVMGGGITKKYSVGPYLSKIDCLVAEHSFPPHIAELQASSKKRKGVQTSIADAFGAAPSAKKAGGSLPPSSARRSKK